MRKIDSDLAREAEVYVINLFDRSLPEEYLFHSKQHTLNVVKNSLFIGQNSGLNDDEMNILLISALFHDAGYILTGDNHEAESSLIAGEFLQSNQVGEEDIFLVGQAILSTKVPQHPVGRISEVLCDADLMHLAGDDYFEQMELLRLEWCRTGRYDLTEHQFHLNSMDFFSRHQYHTVFGKTVLQAKKEETLIRITKRINMLIG